MSSSRRCAQGDTPLPSAGPFIGAGLRTLCVLFLAMIPLFTGCLTPTAGGPGEVSSGERTGATSASARLALALATLEETAAAGEAARTLDRSDTVLAQSTAPSAWLTRLRALEIRGEASLARGDLDAATEAYRQARATLTRHRARLPGPQFAERARPALRRFADLLLRQAARTPSNQAAAIAEAVEALEDLKGAELREYLGDACLANLSPTTPEAFPNATLLYPVILADRVEILVASGGMYDRRRVELSGSELREQVIAFRQTLQDPTTPRYRKTGALLYDLLIRPDADRLIQPGKTLVWVATGALRTVPLAALYDSQQKRFLIEQTAVAALPTLRIATAAPIDPKRARLLALGLAEATAEFPALPAVEQEIDSVTRRFDSTRLIGRDFTSATVAAQLNQEPYDLIHIASHGRFTERADERFLMTGSGRMSFETLAQLIAQSRHRTSRPIELLILSACETAIGDERASLGLGGLAVEMGARSAIAALWQVNDASTARLFEVFYDELAKPGAARSEALRRAQRRLLEDRLTRHPTYWAPFILINGWR